LVNGPQDMPGSYAWEQIMTFTLEPVDQCGYPNILAIAATDAGVVAGIIMQLYYGNEIYLMGSSPYIYLARARAISDPYWYNDPSTNPNIWTPSDSTNGPCPMVPAEIAIQNTYFLPGATWNWVPYCGALYSTIYVKLVVYTHCNCCDCPVEQK
jgi:hypothetical protein